MSTLSSKRLADAFGPYKLADFLQTRKESRIKLSLYCIIFRQENRVVGLDMVDEKRLRDRGPVLFMAFLKIADLNKSCLSDRGMQRLCDDLHRRFGRPATQFLNNPDFQAMVKVCGELFAEPRGLDSSAVFTIISRDPITMFEHEFIIRSLHIQSYALSRTYLSKWALLREVKSIVKQNEQRAPTRIRTPAWLVRKYREANENHFHATNDTPSLTPRMVHRSEVYNLLAKHCHWLSKRLSKDKLLDRLSWETFVKEVENRLNGANASGDRNPNECDELDGLWPEDQLMSDEEDARRDSMEIEDDVVERDYRHTYRQVGGASSEGISPIDESALLVTQPVVFPKALEPLYFQEPVFPTGSKWRCPVDSCDRVVVLRRPPNLDCMTEDDKKFLRSGDWSMNNARAIELFHDIVESHFYEHLGALGIRYLARRYAGLDAMNNPRHEFIELTGPRQTEDENIIGYKFEYAKPRAK